MPSITWRNRQQTLLSHQSHVLKPSLLNAAGSFRMRAQDPLSSPFYPHKEGCKVGNAPSPPPQGQCQLPLLWHPARWPWLILATCPTAFTGAHGHSWGSCRLCDTPAPAQGQEAASGNETSWQGSQQHSNKRCCSIAKCCWM